MSSSAITICDQKHRMSVELTRDATVPDTGANASAEDAEEALEDGPTKVNDIIYSFRLQSSSFDKKSYLSHLKGEIPAHTTYIYPHGRKRRLDQMLVPAN